MKNMKLGLSLGAAGLALLLTASSTSAGVAVWNYENQDGFAAATDTGGGGSNYVPAVDILGGEIFGSGSQVFDPLSTQAGVDLVTRLSWDGDDNGTSAGLGGFDGANSALEVASPVSGAVVTGGAAAPGVSLTHENFTIPLGPALDTFSLWSELLLDDPGNGVGFDVAVGVQMFLGVFDETNNAGPCVDGGATPCDDIFVLLNPGALEVWFQYDAGDGMGLLTYDVVIELEGLGTLSDDACASAGAGPGCQGFLTVEGQENTFNPTFTITQKVPEPATISLLGLGVMAMGFGARRRKKTA